MPALCAALAALALLAGDRAGAQTGPFSANPAWESASASLTRAIAVGDVDRDGYLDLVSGTLGQPNALFRGAGGFFFTTTSAWSPGTASTTSLAFGDVDGDGDLDLVCGNVGPNTLYTNDSGALATSPAWTSSDASTTVGVVLADVDADGDLDLVCANGAAGVSVFRNAGGAFEEPAAWSSARNHTAAVALGDVDGDGVLDLACGNLGEENTLYRGAGGLFETAPSWSSDSVLTTVAVRLGDVDGDGRLDLVCANREVNTAYLNLGATLDTIPAWVSNPLAPALSMDLGDVDQDGDLDAVFGNEGVASTLYRNAGGMLELDPAWSSGRVNDTAGIALADADGDGDLDLVCGNSNQANTVYENLTPPLPASPDWASAVPSQTLGVDVGDVTGDGRPDLVCGNLGSNTLFRNDGTPLEESPAWQSAAAILTTSVALGDVDQDGDLDLVCGNAGATTAYYNAAGVLGLAPAWTSGVSAATTGVALGDVDQDGDLDLVCANASGDNAMFRGNGAAFGTMPAWSAPTSGATDVALGDVDLDGDLDAVFSNTDNTPSTLHRNDGGTFTIAPVWSTGPASTSGSVALGDVDGDGRLDAVFGNVGQPDAVYLNDGVAFDTSPVWSSGPTLATSSVALGDVDSDGDLDLACGSLSQPDVLYINSGGASGGALSTSPSWSSASAVETEDVVFADLDLDGDLDLVCGNEGSPSTAYLGLRNPPYRHDPASPTHQSVNHAAFVSRVAVEAPGVNLRRVRFAIVDVESDPVWLLAEYQFEGEPVWRRAGVGADGVAGPFASSPAGTVDSLDWDVTKIPFDARGVVLRLKAIEAPARVSVVRSIPAHTTRVGPIEPERPEIHPAADAFAFATVTLGDTATVAIPVGNRGNVDLVIDDVRLPSAEMRLDVLLPLVIEPDSTDTLVVLLEPVAETSAGGFIEVASNDVVTPLDSIGVTADIRSLAVTTRLLAAAATIPLGEAATVIVAPAAQVHVERGALFHRAAGSGAFASVQLARSGNDFVAVIPGAAVVEGGIEYYVEVENTPVVATDPAAAPGDSMFFQAVAAPASVASAPRPTAGEDFAAGAAIRVDVELPQGAVFGGGAIYYREGGGAAYGAAPLALDDGVPSATIPDSVVGTRGVEYWVDVQTLTAIVTDPSTDPAGRPRSIRVLVPDLVEPESHPGEVYRLLSVPLDMRGSILGSLADELGGKDNTQWRLFDYDPVAARYRELPSATEARFVLGRAYWLVTREPHRIGTGDDFGLTAPTDAPFEITLEPGYNLVGSPFDFDVAWDSFFVDTLSVADTLASLVVQPPVRWAAGRGYVYDVPTLEPFDGYWVRNRTGASVVLKIPPRAASDDAAAAAAAAAPRSDGWRLEVCAAVADAIAMPATLGAAPGASDAWDRFDRTMPPLPPGRSIAVYFPHEASDEDGAEGGGPYARDLRAGAAFDDASGHVWRFDVVKPFALEDGGDDVLISVDGVDALPVELAAMLVDRRLGRAIDLRAQGTLHAYVGVREAVTREEDARFAVIVGGRGFVDAQSGALASRPERTALFQNHPNPFNPSTVIRYDLDHADRVSLSIYDVRGALVRALEDRERPAGRYEIGWDGVNDRGERVASGVYFYRLVTERYRATRKMVVVK